MSAVDELGRRGPLPSAFGGTGAVAGYPLVSVIVPMRNEESFIGRCLDALQRQEYPAARLEVLVVDGASTDGSVDVVLTRLPGARAPVRLLDNPGVTAARGLNIGVRAAEGDIIIILGAHSEPAPDFVSASVDALWRSEADCVGGKIESMSHGATGEAIALAMASPFGVGDARFRTSDTPGFVDTVAFGAYRRSVFERIGHFDEELERNVDDEFNYRLRAAGGSIYLDPRIRSRYYTRATYRDLLRQYRHYGEWKVVVAQRHPAQMRPRHFVPAAFVGALGLSGMLAVAGVRRPLTTLLAAYGVTTGAAATFTARRATKPGAAPRVALAFACLHLGYGAGFWQGMWRFALRPSLARSIAAGRSRRASTVEEPTDG